MSPNIRGNENNPIFLEFFSSSFLKERYLKGLTELNKGWNKTLPDNLEMSGHDENETYTARGKKTLNNENLPREGKTTYT